MKRFIAAAACVLASLAAVSASAQDHALKANVPFSFYVGNTWVPAGEYILTHDAGSEFVHIASVDRTISVARLTEPAENSAITNELVFNRYGDQYFLREVLGSGSGMRMDLMRSKKEKEASTREKTASASSPSPIYIALR